MNRYGTFSADSNLPSKELRHGVLDSITGREYDTVDLYTAEKLAILLNEPSDCQFNCRASRMTDFEAGWKGSQEFDEAVEKYGDLADKRYGLDVRFEEHVRK